jgi:hypothetical protein
MEKLTPYLEANNQIRRWNGNVESPYKVLPIETNELSSEMIEQIVKDAGYRAVPLRP